ncbi:MAG: hypothetical protein WDZ90_02855 [Candidatus Paceibacterota bacterium]
MIDSLGVDLGNVIIDHNGFGTTPEFFQSGDYNIIPPVSGVFDALSQLSKERFGGNIFVAYNATDVADQKITSWLEAHDFFQKTSVSRYRVRRTQNVRNKLSLCGFYKATHFIDDRLEVMSHLIGKVENLYLLRPQESEVEQYRCFLPYVVRVQTWQEILRLMLT